jgi:hypothetical protein
MAKASGALERASEPGLDRGPGVPARRSSGRPWLLAPSDFAFLWDECRRCFFNKVALHRPRPRGAFPAVFTSIDSAMKHHYVRRRAEEVAPGAPPGVIGGADRFVRSGPIWLLGRSRPLVIRGRVDALVACDDGSTGIIDFKTVEPKAARLGVYSRQLHAYALALEHPTQGVPTTVSSLGLLCFAPGIFHADQHGAVLRGAVRWIAVRRDDRAFESFLSELTSVLELSEAPPPDPACPWCAWELSTCSRQR